MHNRNISGFPIPYRNSEYHGAVNIIRQNDHSFGNSIYTRGLSAQGPDFLHNMKISMPSITLETCNNAPTLANTVIECNKQIKTLESDLKVFKESNMYLSSKIEMLKVLASNFGASSEDIEYTMSANDINSLPRPITPSISEISRDHFEEQFNESYIDKPSTNVNKSPVKKTSKIVPSVANVTKTYSIQSANSSNKNHNKYLTGTRFGPSANQKPKNSSTKSNRMASSLIKGGT
ncbi:uncharacterized protein CMU_034840 [Cryptosporidium muris RN66]|uniref:Uncharacterized protein n=1 Tax=Cryptosporidium muris (strain RN66) TaxID=441375 RepID=B6AFV7_CRYMR|nr:uncharacterized protein CMU_034840 [Cryptosporidium muris RN66]EEA07098.1 hypothetical protein, conserved [Cryptosporidium muris RN66]|eukprot:XP_002141447.1 hypothetical protein [Cryptosporidium muris RN66]